MGIDRRAIRAGQLSFFAYADSAGSGVSSRVPSRLSKSITEPGPPGGWTLRPIRLHPFAYQLPPRRLEARRSMSLSGRNRLPCLVLQSPALHMELGHGTLDRGEGRREFFLLLAIVQRAEHFLSTFQSFFDRLFIDLVDVDRHVGQHSGM